MNKTLEAMIRGYLFFEVNGKRFWLYNSALAERKSWKGSVYFRGFHAIKGWRTFYYRIGG